MAEPFAMVLRERSSLPDGLAPAGPLRDRQAERQRAVANATNKALADVPPPSKHEFTAAGRGKVTDAFRQLAERKPLPVVLAPPRDIAESASHRQRRLAAASRWHKANLGRLAAASDLGAPAQAVVAAPLPLPEVRHVRRGEFEGLKGCYRQYTDAELLEYVYKVRDKELKYSELKPLYEAKQMRVPHAQVGKILYPKEGREERIKQLEQSGLVTMGAPRQARTARAL
jgi:hypothetical protein